MFSRRVFGGTADQYTVTFEYGPGNPQVDDGEQVRLPVATARLHFKWTSDEPDVQMLERFTREQSSLLLGHSEERILVEILSEDIPHASTFPHPKVLIKLSVASFPPVLRIIECGKGTSGTAPQESLLAALLKLCDLKTVWKVRSSEVCTNFWASCVEPGQWASLRNLNLSSCGITSLPTIIQQLHFLKILRASYNKLTSLPPELGALVKLEVLAVDHNQLTAIPGSLRHCTALKELNLESNKLSHPLLDVRHLTSLQSLQLFNNPIEYIPELVPCVNLRSLSISNVRILADANYTRWEVEVANPSYISRTHKLAPWVKVIFRRTACQHPLLAGALGRLAEDPSILELLGQEEVAIQQLVSMAMGTNPVVVRQACKVLRLLGVSPMTGSKLMDHDVASAVQVLIHSPSEDSQLWGLRVLSSLAYASDAIAERLLSEVLLAQLEAIVRDGGTQVKLAALQVLLHALFSGVNKKRFLAREGFPQLVLELAADNPQQNPVAMAAVKVVAALGLNTHVRQCLGLPPMEQRGLRILAMDGGGMKGLGMVQTLRRIEEGTGRCIADLFDVIGGTSTGAILAAGLGVLRLTLAQCEGIYTKLGYKVFNQAEPGTEEPSPIWKDYLARAYKSGSENLRVAMYGYKHDAGNYETVLKEMCRVDEHDQGAPLEHFLDTSCAGGPKVFVVSTLVSMSPASPFLFRNYELPVEVEELAAQMKACRGSSKFPMWQAIRASSAAPYYLDDLVVGEDRFQDGATTANNPTMLAVQQARLLYPDMPIDLVVSLGCGSMPMGRRERSTITAHLDIGTVLIESATAVERVDAALSTLLPLIPGAHYYRFQPVDVRCNMALDDVDPANWAQLIAATRDYLDQPEVAAKMADVCSKLREGRLKSVESVREAQEQGGCKRKSPSRLLAGKLKIPGQEGKEGEEDTRLGFRRGVLVVSAPQGEAADISTPVDDVTKMVLLLQQTIDLVKLTESDLELWDGVDTGSPSPPPILPSKGVTVEPASAGGDAGAQVAVDRKDVKASAGNPAALSPRALASGLVPSVTAIWDYLTTTEARAASSSPPVTSSQTLPSRTSPFRKAQLSNEDPEHHPPRCPSPGVLASGETCEEPSKTRGTRRISADILAVPSGARHSHGVKAESVARRTTWSSCPARASDLAAGTSGILAAREAPGVPPPPVWEDSSGPSSSSRNAVDKRKQPSPWESLSQALMRHAGTVGVVHIGLLASACGFVVQWRTETMAVVEPGEGAANLVSSLGGDPCTTSLGDLFNDSSNWVVPLPDLSLLVLVSRQAVKTRSGGMLETFVFQKVVPEQFLTEQDIQRMVGHWTQILVVCPWPLPASMIKTFLQIGVKAMVAPRVEEQGVDPASLRGPWCYGDEEALSLVDFMHCFYHHLLRGKSVIQSLELAGQTHKSLANHYRCY